MEDNITLDILRADIGIINKIACTDEEYMNIIEDEPLPDGMFKEQDTGEALPRYYKLGKCLIPPENQEEYLKLKQIQLLKQIKDNTYRQARDTHTMKNCLVFITVLIVLGLIISIFYSCSIASNI